ncbi:MAG: UDP-N-acetylmuramate--L-alanine ligase [Candidatus Margulisiibacteriota bacterium]|jgi:UDP-N-acetylmuramate--alanine ligase
MNIVAKKYNSIYMVGIKGGGMTALALLLKGLGKKITGSDTTEVFYTDSVLKKHHISYVEGFKKTNLLKKIDLIIYSTAYDPLVNPEIVEARKMKIKIISYPEALGSIILSKKSIAVAGTHGKTTTTALLSYILHLAGFKPNALVGSHVPQLGGTTLVGNSDLFIVETDEYQNKFKYYYPQAVILTNMEWDHPDFYLTPESYKQAFYDYLKKIPNTGFVVAGIDSPDVLKLVKKLSKEVITFGFSKRADWQAKKVIIGKGITIFEIWYKQKLWTKINTPLKGDFNVNNCLAAVAAASRLGVSKKYIKSSLAKFQGTTRRFEYKGKYKNTIIYDDFGHHPGAIKATLKMVKSYYPTLGSIVVFHPHTYTRTEKLLKDFSQSFKNCNQVVVLDIYSSAREAVGNISSQKLVTMINKFSHNAQYIADKNIAYDYLRKKLNKKSILITMGAGDVWQIGNKLINNNA